MPDGSYSMEPVQRQQLDKFFETYETQAFKMAYMLIRQRDDALELVQDSMLKLVQSYAHKPVEEWKLLFFRILQNRIRDFQRRQNFTRLFTVMIPGSSKSNDEQLSEVPDPHHKTPLKALEQSCELNQVHNALETLPKRQQQTFLLRAWQEFSTEETAFALGISQGSVKTHYSRAIRQLRNILGENHETL